jgi:hypothetical protein
VFRTSENKLKRAERKMKSYGPSVILRSHVDEINCVNITVLDLKLLLIWDFFFGINFGIIYPFPSSLSNCFRDWPVLLRCYGSANAIEAQRSCLEAHLRTIDKKNWKQQACPQFTIATNCMSQIN